MVSHDTFEIADRRVKLFTEEDDRLMQEHKAAMDRLKCEAFLQTGIDAVRWIGLAEQMLLRFHAEGEEIEDRFNGKTSDEWFATCYRMIVTKSESAIKWSNDCVRQGYSVANAREFAKCVESAIDWLDQRDWQSRTASIHDED